MTVLGEALFRAGVFWHPKFHSAPTPGYAATVLGIPRATAELIDRTEFNGHVESARFLLREATENKDE